jgi:hypothetical protein
MLDLKRAFELLLDAFDRLAIPYMVGGSVASSAHGIYRSTNDIDIVARVRPRQVGELVPSLSKEFYLDADTILDAISLGRPFNLIHYTTGQKFDIFPVTDDPYAQVQLERRQPQDVTLAEGQSLRCFVATAEDTVLAKLAWYRAGGEQSDRQWSDLRGICSVQRANLDRPYMRKWARHLGVEDLLGKLLSEEGLA